MRNWLYKLFSKVIFCEIDAARTWGLLRDDSCSHTPGCARAYVVGQAADGAATFLLLNLFGLFFEFLSLFLVIDANKISDYCSYFAALNFFLSSLKLVSGFVWHLFCIFISATITLLLLNLFGFVSNFCLCFFYTLVCLMQKKLWLPSS